MQGVQRKRDVEVLGRDTHRGSIAPVSILESRQAFVVTSGTAVFVAVVAGVTVGVDGVVVVCVGVRR